MTIHLDFVSRDKFNFCWLWNSILQCNVNIQWSLGHLKCIRHFIHFKFSIHGIFRLPPNGVGEKSDKNLIPVTAREPFCIALFAYKIIWDLIIYLFYLFKQRTTLRIIWDQDCNNLTLHAWEQEDRLAIIWEQEGSLTWLSTMNIMHSISRRTITSRRVSTFLFCEYFLI